MKRDLVVIFKKTKGEVWVALHTYVWMLSRECSNVPANSESEISREWKSEEEEEEKEKLR